MGYLARYTADNTKQKQSDKKEIAYSITEFPAGHPREYYPDVTLLSFGDRTGSGVFNVLWP